VRQQRVVFCRRGVVDALEDSPEPVIGVDAIGVAGGEEAAMVRPCARRTRRQLEQSGSSHTIANVAASREKRSHETHRKRKQFF